MAKCKFCGSEIFWVKEGRRNRPFTPDGDLHSCDEMKNSLGSLKTIDPGQLSAEEIAKYEQAINNKAAKK